jgi:hypothetical protein
MGSQEITRNSEFYISLGVEVLAVVALTANGRWIDEI